jgi:nitrite reductase (NADH) large subunit
MRFVIIGNGVAGFTAARELARESRGDSVEVYTQESYHYYPRPRLQEFLANRIRLDELYFRPADWYDKAGIAVHLGQSVTGLDPARKRITLNGEEEVSYDRLLLATGGRPFVPPIPGADKKAVFSYRTLDDVKAIRKKARESKYAVVIGGGLLGLEAAKAMTALGLRVTVLEMFPYLLPRQLDPQGGELLKSLIEDMGLAVRVSAATEAIVGEESASGVRLKDGTELGAGLVLISAGIRSNVALAKDAGLEVNRGVVVNEHLQTTAEDIYAAGDVAEFEGQVYGIVPAALEQARAAARNMLGEDMVYEGTVPSNTLQVVGIDCASVGLVHPEGEGYRELRSTGDRVYKKLVLEHGRLVGAILLGNTEDFAPISRLVRKKADVSAHADGLLDKDFDWGQVR